ncbi:MAG: heavy-metal-associated domain-containing protein [Acidobacteriota bacterium]|nr:heavy-metal-associated domain-containing protein [Acidobacteriota bacterium]
MSTKSFRVPSISCGHCVMTIERELGDLEGIVSARADEKSRMVTVEWEEASLDWEQIEGLLREIQYLPEQ